MNLKQDWLVIRAHLPTFKISIIYETLIIGVKNRAAKDASKIDKAKPMSLY